MTESPCGKRVDSQRLSVSSPAYPKGQGGIFYVKGGLQVGGFLCYNHPQRFPTGVGRLSHGGLDGL